MGQPGALGLVLTSLAAGMLLGGGVYAAIGTRAPRRAWFLTGLIGAGAGFALLGSLASIPVVFAGAFVTGLSSGLFGALIGVLMIVRIPDALRGRVMSTQNALLTIAPSLGVVGAAVVAETTDVGVAALAVAALWALALVIGLFARSLRTLGPVTGSPSHRAGERRGGIDAQR